VYSRPPTSNSTTKNPYRQKEVSHYHRNTDENKPRRNAQAQHGAEGQGMVILYKTEITIFKSCNTDNNNKINLLKTTLFIQLNMLLLYLIFGKQIKMNFILFMYLRNKRKCYLEF